MQNITSIGEAHQNVISLMLGSKAMTLAATTSAVTYLTAYSTDMGQAAQTVPQVINFIGTHGPSPSMSWADRMAILSGLLVVTNLIIGIQKIIGSIKNHFRRHK